MVQVEELPAFMAPGARAMLLGGGDLGRVRAMMPQLAKVEFDAPKVAKTWPCPPASARSPGAIRHGAAFFLTMRGPEGVVTLAPAASTYVAILVAFGIATAPNMTPIRPHAVPSVPSRYGVKTPISR